jgi:choline dehydrogenase
MLFMGLLEVFIRSQCDLEDPCGRPKSRTEPDPIYDFIVVGGGSAGRIYPTVCLDLLYEVGTVHLLSVEESVDRVPGR